MKNYVHLFLVSVQFSSVTQLCPTLCDPMNSSTPSLPVHHQLRNLLKLMSIRSVMPSSHLILCPPLLLPPSIFPSIRVFSSESFLQKTVVVQSVSWVQLFATPLTVAHQAALTSTVMNFAQIHVHQVGDAIQPSHPLSSPSPLAFNLSQHQSLFQWVSSLHQVVKVSELQLQHQSFQWIFRVDFL